MNREQLNALPVFDEQGIASIKKLLGEEFEAIVSEFIHTTPSLIDDLRVAIDQACEKDIIDIAHRLKSGAGNLGLTAFSKVCEYLEHSVRKGDAIVFDEVFARINEQFGRILDS